MGFINRCRYIKKNMAYSLWFIKDNLSGRNMEHDGIIGSVYVFNESKPMSCSEAMANPIQTFQSKLEWLPQCLTGAAEQNNN